LGYFDPAQFQQEQEAGEYSLSRYKAGQLKRFDEQGNELDLLSFLKEQAPEQADDGWVPVGATRGLRARLIAIAVPEEVAIKREQASRRKAHKHGRKVNPLLLELANWRLILTNLGPELLSLQEALVLLRLRWQVELLYKLWKQYAQADTSRSQHPWQMLCDYYAKLLGLLIVQGFMIVGCWQIPSRESGQGQPSHWLASGPASQG
jgi:IS4 transposase